MHTLRKPVNNITRQVLTWTQQGKKGGRPRNTLRRDLDSNVRLPGKTWGLELTKKNRQCWRTFVHK